MTSYQKDIRSLIYHTAVVSSLSLVFNLAAKKFIKMKPADLGKPDLELLASVSELLELLASV